MERRGRATDRHGRVWEAVVVAQDEAEEADFLFWYEKLSPAERVAAVEECLLSALKAKGIREIPRLRRVHRVLEPKWGQVSDRRTSLRRRSPSRADFKRPRKP
jgi:hypothetical protein